MKTLQQLYAENPDQYAKEASKANKAGKLLSADGNGFILTDIPKNTETEESVRSKRNILLRESDWTQLPDTRLSAQDVLKWKTYRQQLRDLPAQDGFPGSAVFPQKP